MDNFAAFMDIYKDRLYAKQRAEEAAKRNTIWYIIALLLTILVAVAGAYAIYRFFKPDSMDDFDDDLSDDFDDDFFDDEDLVNGTGA